MDHVFFMEFYSLDVSNNMSGFYELNLKKYTTAITEKKYFPK